MTVLFEGDLPIDKVMTFNVDGKQQFVRVERVDADYDIGNHCTECILHPHGDWVMNGSKVTRGNTTVQFVNDKQHRCQLGNCMPGERIDAQIVRYVKIE